MSESRGQRGNALIVIPTYNERVNIAAVIPKIRRSVPQVDILVVDDNSPDGTAGVVEELARADRAILLLRRAGKEGYGKAVTAGMQWALQRNYDYVVQMDADLSHDPQFLPNLLDFAREADLVVGSRYVHGGGTRNWSILRQFLSRAGNAYARWVLGLKIKDMTSGFRCWKRGLIECIHVETIKATGYSFMIESLYRAVQSNAKIVEVPIVFVDRTSGKSKMSKRIISEAFLIVWQVRSSAEARLPRAAE